MISLKNVELQLGNKTLFENLNLTIYDGQKIGLVGANGSGKTTLFHLLQGELREDGGEVYIPKNWEIAHLAQEIPSLQQSALDFVLEGDERRARLMALIEQAEQTEDGHKIAELHIALHDIDGYSAPARAAALLSVLGFAAESIYNSVASFSGGWRVRLNLARTLMRQAELMLLDEPTNHLDLEAIVWLESWLKNYRGSMLIISHDRDFLDNTVTHIVHLHEQKLQAYTGNYSSFEQQWGEQLILQQKTNEKILEKRAHLQAFVDRFRAKASKAKQAQSRLKAIAKLPAIQAAHSDSPFSFTISNPVKQPNPLLQLNKADIGYGTKTVLTKVDFSLAPGMRVGLLGLNGAGKSTFIKLLAGDISPLQGEKYQHNDTHIGYFAQHQLDYLHLDESPLQHLQKISTNAREQELRTYLGSFNFCGDQALMPIEKFSGGEKSRLALALLIWQKPNVLLLDEPTNHLDREMREALTQALQTYEGAIVLVSHDRHLLRTTCDEYLLVDEGIVTPFDDTLDGYLTWRQGQKTKMIQGGISAVIKTKPPLDNQERKVCQNRVKSIEMQLEKLQKESEVLTATLADSNLYEAREEKKLQKYQVKNHEVIAEIAALEEEWLMLIEKLQA